MPVVEPTLEIEREYFGAGARILIGCDEVGRGAIAGPVAVGMVAIRVDSGDFPAGVRDSKLLSAKKRESLCPLIESWAVASAVGFCPAASVDRSGIVAALGAAGHAALAQIAGQLGLASFRPAETVILLDGTLDWLTNADAMGARVVTRAKADRDAASVGAASVLAKVSRDRIMVGLDSVHPGFDFLGNKGYGTAAHFEAIRTLGPSAEHRQSWIHL